jgi:hypothetical protein
MNALTLKYFIQSRDRDQLAFIRERDALTSESPFSIAIWKDKSGLNRPDGICINGDYGTNPSYEEMLEMAAIITALAEELKK